MDPVITAMHICWLTVCEIALPIVHQQCFGDVSQNLAVFYVLCLSSVCANNLTLMLCCPHLVSPWSCSLSTVTLIDWFLQDPNQDYAMHV